MAEDHVLAKTTRAPVDHFDPLSFHFRKKKKTQYSPVQIHAHLNSQRDGSRCFSLAILGDDLKNTGMTL